MMRGARLARRLAGAGGWRAAVGVFVLVGAVASVGMAQEVRRQGDVAADALPPEPSAAPPAPARLAPEGAAMVPSAPAPGPALPPGIAALPDGGVRVEMAGAVPDAAQVAALAVLGRALAAIPAGRITVEAQVSGPANDASMARRASLARAQAVKAALVAGGLPATRVDLRPLGRVGEGADRVDVLPPGVASPSAEGRGR